MSEKVDVPWIDEPIELLEAVEMIAQTDEDNEDAIQDLAARDDFQTPSRGQQTTEADDRPASVGTS